MAEARAIKPNLHYPAAPSAVMASDSSAFTPLVVACRITGWTAHFLKQAASPSDIQSTDQHLAAVGLRRIIRILP
ncbi:citrate/2-methylcitrate synthase [Arthrobacter sp. ISL-95]|uniref:citrate/2-methylcitrate synthase n=1 Tax=Arthrobacter sp. ISL-95 TaxID=2819116 RepID=UPI001BE52B59|nr:citrate/2-methylcitrate synthase [Arthrobacter sp. ISL-95]MBT2587149.1 hypothetical protein [Arthrobacter sp. ISL-95]